VRRIWRECKACGRDKQEYDLFHHRSLWNFLNGGPQVANIFWGAFAVRLGAKRPKPMSAFYSRISTSYLAASARMDA